MEGLESRLMFATVSAAVETVPIQNGGDSADDIAVWVHPTDPAQSVIIGTNKSNAGGLVVYGMAGNQLNFSQLGSINNVDVRYDFPLAGAKIDVVMASDRDGNGSLAIHKINPITRELENVAARVLSTGMSGNVYGATLYRSPLSGKFYAFVTSRNGGMLEQWELFDNGAGKIDGTIVRTINVGSTSEAMVVDDQTRTLYVGDESEGIWKYGAEPTAGSIRSMVDSTGVGGHLTADLEGLAIYRAKGGKGYLFASSQGSNDFTVYTRDGNQSYLGRFSVDIGPADPVTHTDGIDVASVNLGPAFPVGAFIAHDDVNSGGQNFKYVPWQSLAGLMSLNTDTTQDPRWMTGDYNLDGVLNTLDIDLMNDELLAAGSDEPFDLTGDAIVDSIDLQFLVETLLFSKIGDTDIDGDVDLSDLSTVAANYGSGVGHWAIGDFDGDGDVDLSDLGALAAHYGAGESQAFADFESLASIPEPAAVGLLAAGWMAMGMRRNSRRGPVLQSMVGVTKK